MSKKILIFVLAFGIVMTLAIGGIAFADQATPVTLTFYPQAYYTPSQFPAVAKMVEQVVKGYENLHPNVTIELIPTLSANEDYETWLTSQFAAGTEPDIAWQQYYISWNQPNLWVSLNKYLETPDTYAATGAGREHWKDVLPSIVWETAVSPSGINYVAPLDWVETGLFYNEAIFDKLGISPNFKTWDQFIQACKVIKAHGYVPLDVYMTTTSLSGGTYDWLDDIMTTAAFADQVPAMYMKKYDEMYPQYYDGMMWRLLTPEETAKAIYDKIYSAYNPRFVEVAKLEKELSPYFPMGFTSLGANGQMSLFLAGRAAMMWNGSWEMGPVEQSAAFKWGLTYFPPFSGQQFPNLPSQFLNTSFRVGGPSAASQYGITIGAEKSHVVSWAVDFLKYLSTPNTWGKVISDAGWFIPMIKGTKMNPSMAFFNKIALFPSRAFNDPSGRFTPTYAIKYYTIMENYLLGSINLATTQKEIQDEVLIPYLNSMESQYHYSWYK